MVVTGPIAFGKDAKGQLGSPNFTVQRKRGNSTSPSTRAGSSLLQRRGSLARSGTRGRVRPRSAPPPRRAFSASFSTRRAPGRSSSRAGSRVRRRKCSTLLHRDASLIRDDDSCDSLETQVYKKAHATLDLAWQLFGEARVLVQFRRLQEALRRLENAKRLIDVTEGVDDCCSIQRHRRTLLQLGQELHTINRICTMRGSVDRQVGPPDFDSTPLSTWSQCDNTQEFSDPKITCPTPNDSATTKQQAGSATRSDSTQPDRDYSFSPAERRIGQKLCNKVNYMERVSERSLGCSSARGNNEYGNSVGPREASGAIDVGSIPSVLSAREDDMPRKHLNNSNVASFKEPALSKNTSFSSSTVHRDVHADFVDEAAPPTSAAGRSTPSSCYGGPNHPKYRADSSVRTPRCAASWMEANASPSLLAGSISALSSALQGQSQQQVFHNNYVPSDSNNYIPAKGGRKQSFMDGINLPVSSRLRSAGGGESYRDTFCQSLRGKFTASGDVARDRFLGVLSAASGRENSSCSTSGRNTKAAEKLWQKDSIFDLGDPKLVKLYSFERKSPQKGSALQKKMNRSFKVTYNDANFSTRPSTAARSGTCKSGEVAMFRQLAGERQASTGGMGSGRSFYHERGRSEGGVAEVGAVLCTKCCNFGESSDIASGIIPQRLNNDGGMHQQADCGSAGNIVLAQNLSSRRASIGSLSESPTEAGAFHRYFAGIKNYHQARMLHKTVVEQLLLEHEIEEMETEKDGATKDSPKEILLRHLEDAYNSWLVSHLGNRQRLTNKEVPEEVNGAIRRQSKEIVMQHKHTSRPTVECTENGESNPTLERKTIPTPQVNQLLEEGRRIGSLSAMETQSVVTHVMADDSNEENNRTTTAPKYQSVALTKDGCIGLPFQQSSAESIVPKGDKTNSHAPALMADRVPVTDDTDRYKFDGNHQTSTVEAGAKAKESVSRSISESKGKSPVAGSSGHGSAVMSEAPTAVEAVAKAKESVSRSISESKGKSPVAGSSGHGSAVMSEAPTAVEAVAEAKESVSRSISESKGKSPVAGSSGHGSAVMSEAPTAVEAVAKAKESVSRSISESKGKSPVAGSSGHGSAVMSEAPTAVEAVAEAKESVSRSISESKGKSPVAGSSGHGSAVMSEAPTAVEAVAEAKESVSRSISESKGKSPVAGSSGHGSAVMSEAPTAVEAVAEAKESVSRSISESKGKSPVAGSSGHGSAVMSEAPTAVEAVAEAKESVSRSISESKGKSPVAGSSGHGSAVMSEAPTAVEAVAEAKESVSRSISESKGKSPVAGSSGHGSAVMSEAPTAVEAVAEAKESVSRSISEAKGKSPDAGGSEKGSGAREAASKTEDVNTGNYTEMSGSDLYSSDPDQNSSNADAPSKLSESKSSSSTGIRDEVAVVEDLNGSKITDEAAERSQDEGILSVYNDDVVDDLPTVADTDEVPVTEDMGSKTQNTREEGSAKTSDSDPYSSDSDQYSSNTNKTSKSSVSKSSSTTKSSDDGSSVPDI